MNLETLKAFFMWCSIINMALLWLSFALCIKCADWAYAMHSKWFNISRVSFNTVIYAFLGLYKTLVIVFFIIPWIALCIIG